MTDPVDGIATEETTQERSARIEREAKEAERDRILAQLASLSAAEEERDRLAQLTLEVEALEDELQNALAMLTVKRADDAEPDDQDHRSVVRAATTRTDLRKRAERLFDAAHACDDGDRASRAYALTPEATELEAEVMARAERLLAEGPDRD